MKKIFILAILSAIFGSINGQVTLFQESFNGSIPNTWTVFSGSTSTATGDGHWTYSSWNFPTVLYGTTPGNVEIHDEWLVSPLISIPPSSTLIPTLQWDWKGYSYAGAGNLMVKISIDSGTTWSNPIWAMTDSADVVSSGNVPWPFQNWHAYTSTLDISTYAGQNIKIAWHYMMHGGYMVGVDDVKVYTVSPMDLELLSINTPDVAKYGNIDITGTIKNIAGGSINSFDVNYKINGGTLSSTYHVTGIQVGLNGIYNFTHNVAYNFNTDGNYSIKVIISNVNSGSETNTSNNSLIKNIYIDDDNYAKQTLFEIFTGSTCSSCPPTNTNFDSFTNMINQNEFTLVKYQMNWPSPGDPYYTAEGGVRKNSYHVTGVPHVEMDAHTIPLNITSQSALAIKQKYQDTKIMLTDISMSAIHDIDSINKTVAVKVIINSHNAHPNLNLYVIVLEKTTTGNVGTNGETEFHNVMMKMVPNAYGTVVNIPNNTSNYIVNASLTGTHVEEYSDLAVIAFLQDTATQRVYQSTNSVKGVVGINTSIKNRFSIYPNPTSNYIYITNITNATISIYDIQAKLILCKEKCSGKQYKVNLPNLENGIYFIKVEANKEIITKKLIILN
jgi:hypothetical protein